MLEVFLSSGVHFRSTLVGRIIRHLSFFACHSELELAALFSWFWFCVDVERVFTTGVEDPLRLGMCSLQWNRSLTKITKTL